MTFIDTNFFQKLSMDVLNTTMGIKETLQNLTTVGKKTQEDCRNCKPQICTSMLKGIL